MRRRAWSWRRWKADGIAGSPDARRSPWGGRNARTAQLDHAQRSQGADPARGAGPRLRDPLRRHLEARAVRARLPGDRAEQQDPRAGRLQRGRGAALHLRERRPPDLSRGQAWALPRPPWPRPLEGDGVAALAARQPWTDAGPTRLLRGALQGEG